MPRPDLPPQRRRTHRHRVASLVAADEVELTPCQIHKALETMNQLPAPTTPQEGRDSVDFIVEVYGAVVEGAPAERADAAASVERAMRALRAEGEAAGYGGGFLSGPPAALQTSEFNLASEVFRDDYADACDPASATTPTTTPTTGG